MLIMEQLTEQVTIRVTEEDVKLLRTVAEKQKRSVAWIARECMRQGLETYSSECDHVTSIAPADLRGDQGFESPILDDVSDTHTHTHTHTAHS